MTRDVTLSPSHIDVVKKEAGDLGLRHAALTRLSSAALTFAYFLRTYFCDRVSLPASIAVDPTSIFFREKKEP